MVRIAIVTDVRIYREGLEHLLGARPAIEVTGSAETVAGGFELARRARPDFVLLDTAMLGSIDAVRHLLTAAPEIGVLGLNVGDDDQATIALAESGACGCVTRDSSIDDVVLAIESAARGEMLCSARMAAALLRRVGALAARAGPEPAEAHLTSRELDVLGLIDAGLSNKQIAGELCIELPTVKNHVHNILRKLGVARRGQAANRARIVLRPRPLGGARPTSHA